MLILLTGAVKSGKTTACWRALPGARARGLRITGFVSPALLGQGGAKTGIEMVNLSTGEHHTLAHVVRPGEIATVGAYRMSDDAANWAQRVMASALMADADWLVIDEIGPLELHQGGGFAFALDPLSDPLRVPNAIVMVREALVNALTERLGRVDVVVVRVTPENRAQIPDQLIKLMLSP